MNSKYIMMIGLALSSAGLHGCFEDNAELTDISCSGNPTLSVCRNNAVLTCDNVTQKIVAVPCEGGTTCTETPAGASCAGGTGPAEKCENGVHYYTDGDGKPAKENCPNGCDGTKCKEIPGQQERCENGVHYYTDGDGKPAKENCPYGCNGTKCAKSPENEEKCENGVHYYTDSYGNPTKEGCPYGCDGKKCKASPDGTCSAASFPRRCSDSTHIQYCDESTGTVKTERCPDNGICRDDDCQKSGNTTCEDETHQKTCVGNIVTTCVSGELFSYPCAHGGTCRQRLGSDSAECVLSQCSSASAGQNIRQCAYETIFIYTCLRAVDGNYYFITDYEDCLSNQCKDGVCEGGSSDSCNPSSYPITCEGNRIKSCGYNRKIKYEDCDENWQCKTTHDGAETSCTQPCTAEQEGASGYVCSEDQTGRHVYTCRMASDGTYAFFKTTDFQICPTGACYNGICNARPCSGPNSVKCYDNKRIASCFNGVEQILECEKTCRYMPTYSSIQSHMCTESCQSSLNGAKTKSCLQAGEVYNLAELTCQKSYLNSGVLSGSYDWIITNYKVCYDSECKICQTN